MSQENWDDKTDEIVAQCVDLPNKQDSFWLEENRTKERFRVRYFHNGVQVGSPMYAFDMEGVYALIRILTGDRGAA